MKNYLYLHIYPLSTLVVLLHMLSSKHFGELANTVTLICKAILSCTPLLQL